MDFDYGYDLVDQPPTGGCVLKLRDADDTEAKQIQPPTGGCVLKHLAAMPKIAGRRQPPTGGCVLKLMLAIVSVIHECQPPTGGCVLKRCQHRQRHRRAYSAAHGRLCVETRTIRFSSETVTISRPRAAVC